MTSPRLPAAALSRPAPKSGGFPSGRHRALGSATACIFGSVLSLTSCTASIDSGGQPSATGTGSQSGSGSNPGTGSTTPVGAQNGSTGAASGSGGTTGTGSVGSGGTGAPDSTSPTPLAAAVCPTPNAVNPGRAPIRRLTRFEYNNTVRDLLADSTAPGNGLPADETGNGFGNDAEAISVSSLLAEQYGTVAEGIAARATKDATALGKLASCTSSVTSANEATCARTIMQNLLPKAFRRPIVTSEVDAYVNLFTAVRTNGTFASSVAAMLETALQSAHFLYRPELGTADATQTKLRRPTGPEMASRLSYFLWGTMPDDTLRTAAAAGELSTKAGVLTHAKRMVADAKTRPVVRYFFDNLLPISGLTSLERDTTIFKTFSATVGNLMHEEAQRVLEYEIFDGSGTWRSVLTAPYTFLNGPLASFYGVTGVSGDAFQKVALDTTKRLGLLTLGGVMAGTTASNHTNPVTRGSFIVQKLMCRAVPPPPQELLDKVKPPDPYSAKTARERYSIHSSDPTCAACHKSMDPIGLALENYDPVGLYRATENDVPIDASGSVPGMPGTVNGPTQLVQALAESQDTQNCFANHMVEFAYGVTLRAEDACMQAASQTAFKASGTNIRQLLVDLTQTDAFQYLPTP